MNKGNEIAKWDYSHHVTKLFKGNVYMNFCLVQDFQRANNKLQLFNLFCKGPI